MKIPPRHPSPRQTRRRAGRALAALIGFLTAFVILLFLVINKYLLPASEAAVGADKIARKQLAAISSLVLIVVLFCLFSLLLIAFRPGRFFLPRKNPPRARTQYVDAWAESAKRVQVDDDDEEEKPLPPHQ